MNRTARTRAALLSLMAVVAISVLFTPQSGNAITIGVDRLLGTVEPGTPSSGANELVMLNFLIAGYNAGGVTGANLGDNTNDDGVEANYLLYSAPTEIPDDPNAPLATGYVEGGEDVTSLSTGTSSYDWVGVKYGNDTAFFYVGDLAAGMLLEFIGGTAVPFVTTGGRGLSHSTLFTATTNQVPDGGMTLALLGMGIMSVAFLRRRLG